MAKTDDSELYTGVTMTGPFENVPEDVKQIEAEEQEEYENRQMLPSVELILEAIDEEIKAASDIRSYFQQTDKTGDGLMNEFRARELYFEYLVSLKSIITQKVDVTRDTIKGGQDA